MGPKDELTAVVTSLAKELRNVKDADESSLAQKGTLQAGSFVPSTSTRLPEALRVLAVVVFHLTTPFSS